MVDSVRGLQSIELLLEPRWGLSFRLNLLYFGVVWGMIRTLPVARPVWCSVNSVALSIFRVRNL